MSTILECKNLSKKYGRKQALDNITLSLESGKISVFSGQMAVERLL